jgi:hypothetical protein
LPGWEDNPLSNATERDGILVKVRLDFKGKINDKNFFFRGKSSDRAAEEAREQQLALFRNVPVQGAQIIDLDAGADVYSVYDEFTNTEVAYAPLILTIEADNIESILKFTAREDFRKIEVLDPSSITLNHNEVERILYRVYEEIKELRTWLEKKYK